MLTKYRNVIKKYKAITTRLNNVISKYNHQV